MAPTATEFTRTIMKIVALAAVMLFGMSTLGLGEEALLPMAGADAPAIPDRERLPLGSPSQAVEGDASQDAGYLPEVMEFVRVGGALVVVVGLLLGMRAVLRRLGGLPSTRRPSGVVKVHARYPVARGQQIVLLQVGRRIIVTHQGGGGMRTLSEITEPGEVEHLEGLLDSKAGQGSRVKDNSVSSDGMEAGSSSGEVVDLTRQGARAGKQGLHRSRLPRWGRAT